MKLFRTLLQRLLPLCVLAAAAVSAQAYPAKPIEWVVPYPAGGGTDAVARVLADAVGKTLGQAIIINNKPGAATNIGAEYVARAKADGYVLLSADTATLAALGSTTVQARFQTLGLEATPSSPSQMAAYAKSEREKWGQLIRASGIKLD